jgi:hypothetical protein
MATAKEIFMKAKGFVTGNKSYWDKIAKQRNQVADKRLMLNRLPNAATNYRDFPNNRIR